MFEDLKLGILELKEVILRKEQLALAGAVPKENNVFYAGCGDGTCAQSCSGGCGKDCSAFFSECTLKI